MPRESGAKRGAASHPCPECGSPTRVRWTRRQGRSVLRERECRRHKHRYRTLEATFRREIVSQ